MLTNKIIRHFLFWLVFFSMSLYNELYLSVSFSSHPTLTLLLGSIVSQVLLFLPKVLVVYAFLYAIIPHWTNSKSKIPSAVFGIALLFVGTLCMRLITQQIIWKLIYGEAGPDLQIQQIIARFFYSFLDLLQITAIACSVKLFRMRLETVKKEKQLVKEKLSAEMLHLRSQTNPHFLFNTLNSIYALSRTKSEQAPDAVMKLSQILRYMLYETDKATKLIVDELKVIEDYIQLQQLRFGDRIRFDLHENIDDPYATITPLLLLPLIENAYKHSNQSEAVIKADIELHHSRLKMSVSNPIAEISVPGEEQQGIGLGNIKRQLELLYKEFYLSYGEKNGIFTVNLEIALNSYAETELFDTGR